MKNILISILFFICAQTFAQKTYNLDQKTDSVSYTQTKDFAVYHGETLPVYLSKKGKLFIFVVSKSGNKYKKYLN